VQSHIDLGSSSALCNAWLRFSSSSCICLAEVLIKPCNVWRRPFIKPFGNVWLRPSISLGSHALAEAPHQALQCLDEGALIKPVQCLAEAFTKPLQCLAEALHQALQCLAEALSSLAMFLLRHSSSSCNVWLRPTSSLCTCLAEAHIKLFQQ
ncbi:hypothetical protein RRG08_021524, partial [Elysia crispata]